MNAYTYRCGEKIELEKSRSEIVVRSLPHELDDVAMLAKEQVSSASTKINVAASELEELMLRTRAQAVTHHAYYEKQTGAEFLITDRVLLTVKENTNDYELDQLAGRYALQLIKQLNERDYVYRLSDATGMNPVKLIVQLSENESLIDIAEHDLNHRIRKYGFEVPTDPNYISLWHLHNRLNHPQVDPRSSSRCEQAWQLLDGFGSPQITLAVSDDGCKLDHRDFDSPAKFAGWAYLRGTNLIRSFDFNADPEQMYLLDANHGTSCCGVIAGEKDSELTVGAAPDCKLLPIQWQSSGPSLFISDLKLLDVLNYISDKADVMSNSWGYPVETVWSSQVVNRITQLTQTGGPRNKGILFLWAAGNENCLINETVNSDVPFTNGFERITGSYQWVGVQTSRIFRNNLVGIPGVMHIAALASTAQRSHYSNYGFGISLTAPSSNSHKYWRMQVNGLGVTTVTGSQGSIESSFAVTDDFGGTSSATPLVAGIAGLCLSANPELTAFDLEKILKTTATKDLNFNGYAKTPPANYDLNPTWDVSPVAPHEQGNFQDLGLDEGSWSPWFGHGCVNAEAAVAEALARQVQTPQLQFTGNSAPLLDIPDDDLTGVQDHITVPDQFELDEIKVRVNIEHSYIGDLRIALISPLGTTVLLHDRNGGSTNNIDKTFDTTMTPGLLLLSGEAVDGDWRIHIQDAAGLDVGRLLNWSLELSGKSLAPIQLDENPAVLIPDNSPAGIERQLTVNASGLLEMIDVDLDITHSFINDLNVELISPSNTRVILHRFTGGSNDNIIKTFNFSNTPALQVLRNERIDGHWRLQVSDHANADQGKLNRWALKIRTVA